MDRQGLQAIGRHRAASRTLLQHGGAILDEPSTHYDLSARA